MILLSLQYNAYRLCEKKTSRISSTNTKFVEIIYFFVFFLYLLLNFLLIVIHFINKRWNNVKNRTWLTNKMTEQFNTSFESLKRIFVRINRVMGIGMWEKTGIDSVQIKKKKNCSIVAVTMATTQHQIIQKRAVDRKQFVYLNQTR